MGDKGKKDKGKKEVKKPKKDKQKDEKKISPAISSRSTHMRGRSGARPSGWWGR